MASVRSHFLSIW